MFPVGAPFGPHPMSDVSPEYAPKQTCRPLVHTLAEHLVEFAAGITVSEFGERPLLRHLL
jgi:hypothetical protein